MGSSTCLQHILDNKAALLADLRQRQGVVRDYVRGVAGHYSTGLYLFGSPGTAKTFLVKSVLDQEPKASCCYQRGHLTPMGLFELLAQNADGVIVLVDLFTIFRNDVALQILLSALEPPARNDRTRSRVVRYRKMGSEEQVFFRVGIICITNRVLHDDALLAAFQSRVKTLNYNPSDAQLGALMLDIAERGRLGVKPEEALAVARFVIDEMVRRSCRFDLRLFFNKALPDYVQWKDKKTESDWRDLVTASIEQHLTAVRHHCGRLSRADRKLAEQELVRQIVQENETRLERVRAWTARTGKSPRAFDRRLAEIQ